MYGLEPHELRIPHTQRLFVTCQSRVRSSWACHFEQMCTVTALQSWHWSRPPRCSVRYLVTNCPVSAAAECCKRLRHPIPDSINSKTDWQWSWLLIGIVGGNLAWPARTAHRLKPRIRPANNQGVGLGLRTRSRSPPQKEDSDSTPWMGSPLKKCRHHKITNSLPNNYAAGSFQSLKLCSRVLSVKVLIPSKIAL